MPIIIDSERIKPFALFHHSVCDYMYLTVTFLQRDRGSVCGLNICFKLGTVSEFRLRFRANKTGLSHPGCFEGGCSVAVLLCASVVSCVSFALSLFVPHFFFFWSLRIAVFLDCNISRYLHLCYLQVNKHCKY